MADTNRPLRVLIAGAGIGGLATAIALTRISGIQDLDIQIYEQAPELREIGASIALSPNGMRTLERLGICEALDDDLGFRGPSGIPQIFRHWQTNQVVSVDTHTNVPDRRHQTTRFHRGHVHAALIAHVPKSSIHLSKRVKRAEVDNNGVTLLFEDGSSAQGDILIGADGIRSKVRQSLLPDYQLQFTGKVFMRSTFDTSLVEGKIPNLPLDAIHWWGPKDSFFASKLGKGQYTTVGAYEDSRTNEEVAKTVTWDQPGSIDFFRDKYKDWNPIVKTLTELTPYVRLYPNYAGTALSTWLPAPRVALLGDAAHTHGGAFAAGGSLALNDALALALALKHVAESKTPGAPLQAPDLQHALQLYDKTRRPHATRLLNIVHYQLHKKSPTYSSPEEEESALMARFQNRPDLTWLSEHDVEKAFHDVVAEYRKDREVQGQQDNGIKTSEFFEIQRSGSSYWAFTFPALCIVVVGTDLEFNVVNVSIASKRLFLFRVADRIMRLMYVVSALPNAQQSIASSVFQTTIKLAVTIGLGAFAAIFASVSEKPATTGYYAHDSFEPYAALFWFATALSFISLLLVPFLRIKTQGNA